MKRNEQPFRVGVTGHRWNGLREADVSRLEQQVENVLLMIQQTVQRTPLHFISPVAEGSDRIVAKAALRLGYKLHCILPFAKTLYEEDFESDESKEEFHRLLEKAESVLELPKHPTSNETRDAAYTAAGRTVTAESDLLLAIWDGQEARGEGGTGQMVKEALEHSRLVIWINAKAPHEVCLLNQGGGQEDISALSGRIERILKETRRVQSLSKTQGDKETER
jgi:hypothetical protein